MNLSSLSSPNFATSYSLASLGVVDGSISYLYSSLPLQNVDNSSSVPLLDTIRSYRSLDELRKPDDPKDWEVWQGGKRVDRRGLAQYFIHDDENFFRRNM